MIQGTHSNAGKSVITAAILRILRNRGIKAAPFKAQNMALNSFVTSDGCEIGRAQAFQAEAAGCVPTVHMNPILLKPTGDSLSQVIIHGRPYGMMSASEYHSFKKEARRFVLESYLSLAKDYEVIVIEGAGSPAEVNLRENDLANMGIAEMCDSPVLIVGDIDRGGVFASIVGTLELLSEGERERVKGFIINRFRGDIGLLRPGLEFLQKRTGKPVLGVVPYIKDIALPDEDSVSLDVSDNGKGGGADKINIAVIKLPRISNFTDFDPLKVDESVELRFIENPEDISGADLVIIPGTKNTLGDLEWLKEKGFAEAIRGFHKAGGTVAGICGGFQMLGKRVSDPHAVESSIGSAEGLKLLDSETTLKKEKATFQVLAGLGSGSGIKGYEIHMGETASNEAPFSTIKERNGKKVNIKDGSISKDLRVWGTYIHGLFENDGFRNQLLSELKRKKGIGAVSAGSYGSIKEAAIERLARTVEENIDMEMLRGFIGLTGC
ncbi:MAG: cobyric acid synthase [Deltaproteobacteria bacterium]|nr:cobyric acid synthase [Deltaproteobacteria bacterium]